jgi:hypothetical protein
MQRSAQGWRTGLDATDRWRGTGSERLLAALGGEMTEVLGCWVGYVSGVIFGCWVWVAGLPGAASLVGASTFFILNFLKFSFEKKIERFGGLKRF